MPEVQQWKWGYYMNQGWVNDKTWLDQSPNFEGAIAPI
jgi:hypothetical protein